MARAEIDACGGLPAGARGRSNGGKSPGPAPESESDSTGLEFSECFRFADMVCKYSTYKVTAIGAAAAPTPENAGVQFASWPSHPGYNSQKARNSASDFGQLMVYGAAQAAWGAEMGS